MEFLGPLGSFTASVTWSIAVSSYALLSKKHSPYVVNFTRTILSFASFLALTLILGRGNELAKVTTTQIGWLGITIIGSYALGDILFLYATRKLGVPGTLAIASTYPILSAAAGWAFRGEALGPASMAGLLISVSGSVLIVVIGYREQGASGPTEEGSYALGVVFAVATSMLWALTPFAMAQASGHGISTIALCAVRMGIGAIAMAVICGARAKDRATFFLPATDFQKYFWLFLMEGFVGVIAYVYGVSHCKLAVAATLSSLSPVLTVPIAWIKRTERVSLLKTAGVSLVTAGILCLAFSPENSRIPAAKKVETSKADLELDHPRQN